MKVVTFRSGLEHGMGREMRRRDIVAGDDGAHAFRFVTEVQGRTGAALHTYNAAQSADWVATMIARVPAVRP